jgi:hypothetical protein
LELLFAVPILFFLLIAACVYGQVMMVRCGVTQAATVAAREAGKGGDVQDVAEAVNRVLAAYGVAITDRAGSGTKVILDDGFSEVSEYGDPSMTYVKPRGIGAGEVLTTVWIKTSAKKADGTTAIVHSLGGLGTLLHSEQICVSSLVKKDLCGR